MANPPKVFISATSGDLLSARQIVKDALLTINCHPVFYIYMENLSLRFRPAKSHG